MDVALRVRVVAALGAAALVSLAVPLVAQDQARAAASPVTISLKFKPGTDARAWFWSKQVDEELGAGPVAKRQRLPSPQRKETLPVAYQSGESSKQAALRFDLADRGVPAGSKVTKLTLVIVEETEGGEAPTVNPNARVVRGCNATSEWTSGEAELWDTRPEASDVCAKGKRKEQDVQEGEPPVVTWHFDLSKPAATWGEDPFANYGVLFDGVTPKDSGADETWQVNLKTPQRDNPDTPINEYKETVDRVKAKLTYIPGSGKTGGTGTGTGAAGGGGAPDSGAAPGGGKPPAAGPDTGDKPTPTAGEPFRPRAPWYVWLLIPAALLAAYLVRGALADGASSSGTGVIELIRRQNLLRRGGPLPEQPGPLARLTGRFRGGRR